MLSNAGLECQLKSFPTKREYKMWFPLGEGATFSSYTHIAFREAIVLFEFMFSITWYAREHPAIRTAARGAGWGKQEWTMGMDLVVRFSGVIHANSSF